MPSRGTLSPSGSFRLVDDELRGQPRHAGQQRGRREREVQRVADDLGTGVPDDVVREVFPWEEYILARSLVDDPDAVRVEQVEREDVTVLELYVAPEDRGKVIGRQGRLARALRTIVRASAARSRKRIVLEIVE